MMELLLSRDGIAGMCGVCGDIGLPGEEEVEKELPAIMPGTLCSCLLDVDDERCNIKEDDMDSDSWVVDSRMRANFEY